MPEIVAANNLTIGFDATQWTLISPPNGAESAEPIVSATRDGLFFQPHFATARRLPSANRLDPEQFTMIVVGYASEDASWHLGLLLAAEIAETRGGRWCGLARWDASDKDSAQQAGRALAGLLQKPFRLIEPGSEAAPAEAPAEPAPVTVVSLAPLPIHLNDWVFEEDPVGLVFRRTQPYSRSILWRAIFFGVLTPLFGALSLGAILSIFAPVQPEWLPYLGLVITLVLLVITITQVLNVLRNPTTLVDRRARLLRLMVRNGQRTVVQSPFEGLDYLLVSHMINRRKLRPKSLMTVESPEAPAPETPLVPEPPSYTIWAEMWIHGFSPRRGFIELCHLTDIEGHTQGDIRFTERRELNLTEISSPAHHVAVWISREIDDLPIFVEER